MMNLEEIRKAYEDLSRSLSSAVRQFNFAGIAIVWIFVGKDSESVPQQLYNACTFFVLSIALDALQYFISTLIWQMCYLYKHKKNTADKDINVCDSEWINAVPWVCIYLKTIFTAIGYWYILLFLRLYFSLW